MKNYAMMFLLVLATSLVMAIQPAESWTVLGTGKYTQLVQANVTTEGGNVTNMDVGGNASTERWAGFWGNVTGRIVLSPATALFYSWAWTPANGGEVCAVAAPSGFDWAAVQTTTAAAVNSVWSFGAGTDNATNTYTSSACNLDVAGTPVTTVGNLTGVGGFETCVVADNAAPAAKDELAFCVNVTAAGNLFNGNVGNYELLVPANETAGATETYYFWLELD